MQVCKNVISSRAREEDLLVENMQYNLAVNETKNTMRKNKKTAPMEEMTGQKVLQ